MIFNPRIIAWKTEVRRPKTEEIATNGLRLIAESFSADNKKLTTNI